MYFIVLCCQTTLAQNIAKTYEFTDEIVIPHTSIKDQGYSGTCWAFATISMIESEMMSSGTKEELSEMYVVAKSYEKKVENYIRMHGNLEISQGGEFDDVLKAIGENGIVRRREYKSKGLINHTELEKDILSCAKYYVEQYDKRLSPLPHWRDSVRHIVEKHLGVCPQKTTAEDGNEQTPQEFSQKVVGFDADDYVWLCSFTHHDFYKPFVLEVPDNWLMSTAYNVPLDEYVAVVDSSLSKGYSIAASVDITELSISCMEGIGVLPDADNMTSEEKKAYEEANALNFISNRLASERSISPVMQSERQAAFDNYKFTDDHAMHIVGTAHDKLGRPYYKLKNSWGSSMGIHGYVYLSKPYFAYRSISMLVNKKALPQSIKRKLGI